MLSIRKRKQIRWKNWSESIYCEPENYFRPKNLTELIEIVEKCHQRNKTIRVVGAGHSFTPLVATSEVLVSIDELSGIDKIDRDNNLITVWGGSKLKELGEQLHAHGYAMENLGDINTQSIAGAISTGTHGTGVKFGSISTQVASVTILTSSGKLMDISPSVNEHLFEAVKLSLGMLGIIIKVTLKVVPAYQLVGHSYRYSLENCLQQLNELKDANRNFEFFWFPYTNKVQVKTMNKKEGERNIRPKQHTFKKIVMENGVFLALSEMSRIVPRTAKMVSTISSIGVPVGSEIDDSHSLYATPRLVKFHEMEYSVPADAMGSVLQDIDKAMKKKRFNVHFPIECRYVKGDSIWLSPSYKRDSAYIAVHMYKGMDYTDYFATIENIFQYYEGRPHWGKMHTMTYDKLVDLYPRLIDFLKIRSQLDHRRLFVNEYIRKLFRI